MGAISNTYLVMCRGYIQMWMCSCNNNNTSIMCGSTQWASLSCGKCTVWSKGKHDIFPWRILQYAICEWVLKWQCHCCCWRISELIAWWTNSYSTCLHFSPIHARKWIPSGCKPPHLTWRTMECVGKGKHYWHNTAKSMH